MKEDERHVYGLCKYDVVGYVELPEVTGGLFDQFNQGWYSYIKDQVGTISKVYSDYTQQMIDTRTYDVFGNIVNQTGSSNGNLGFHSKYFDHESGLNYFYHRYYNPVNGRFMNEDPIGFLGGANFYRFNFNNPIKWTDPYGLHTLCFDGKRIHVYDDCGNKIMTRRASSGFPGTGPEDQDKKYKGPIPEGKWTFNIEDIDKRAWYNFLRDPEWGTYRVKLNPVKGTETYGRTNLFLHGGVEPGTAGCVDMGIADEEIFPMLMSDESHIKIDFHVKYGGCPKKWK